MVQLLQVYLIELISETYHNNETCTLLYSMLMISLFTVVDWFFVVSLLFAKNLRYNSAATIASEYYENKLTVSHLAMRIFHYNRCLVLSLELNKVIFIASKVSNSYVFKLLILIYMKNGI